MIVRRARHEDAKALALVAQAAGVDVLPEGMPSEGDESNIVYVTEVDDVVVGFLALRSIAPPPFITARSPLQLWRMGVRPEFHGKGIARSLTGRALVHAHGGGHDVVWLEIPADNRRGVAFYGKCGFAIAGTSAAVSNGDHRALVLSCSL